MSERSGREVGVTEAAQEGRHCPTCERLLAAEAFYVNCGECKECKRRRSRNNRAVQARKIAAFERFLDVFVDLIGRTAERPVDRQPDMASKAAADAPRPDLCAPDLLIAHRPGAGAVVGEQR
jgi:hypothetical protein